MASARAPTATFVETSTVDKSEHTLARSAADHRPKEHNVPRLQALRSSKLDATDDATAELCTKPCERYSSDLAHAHNLIAPSINPWKRELNRRNDEHNRYPNQAPQRGRCTSIPASDRNCADSSQGHIVTLEITSGEVYRGKLIEGVFVQILGNWRRALTANSRGQHERAA